MNQQVNSSSAAAPYGMAGPNAPLPVPPTKAISIESIPNQVRQRFLKGMCNVVWLTGCDGRDQAVQGLRGSGQPAGHRTALVWIRYASRSFADRVTESAGSAHRFPALLVCLLTTFGKADSAQPYANTLTCFGVPAHRLCLQQ